MAETIYEIEVDFPQGEKKDRTLHMALGACKFQLAPDADNWITGEYRHPGGDGLPIRVKQKNGDIHIFQEMKAKGIPALFGGTPKFDLHLGKGQPYAIEIDAGAFDGKIDLGGLPLTGLKLSQGAASVVIDFSAPNPVEMKELEVNCGAMRLDLRNLANANFARFSLEGGASSYVLDFGGELRRDAKVAISAGVARVQIRIPASTAAEIVVDNTLGGVRVGDGFIEKGDTILTPAATEGLTPVLKLHISLTMGSLSLECV